MLHLLVVDPLGIIFADRTADVNPATNKAGIDEPPRQASVALASKPAATAPSSSSGASAKDVGLLANKHYLAWSGVAVGDSESLTLTLKNPNAEIDLRVSLEVRMSTGGSSGDQQPPTAFWIPTG